ncbi:hypothetical protein [Brevibacillus sp. NL20B1]|uniref:WapI family immunity protein n=1 Tax=Brevibacillus sp. NL20B1 TaxID=2829799 RepID=UPI001B986E02|nr:hypothetical protein [Brevibacillus sp. NL20B1]MBR8661818.1 hypothetical protein [Brevibacillus sp. NL20B1]
MSDRISILSTENHCIDVEHLYTVEGYITLALTIKSGDFKGKSNFCFSKETLTHFIQSLKEMGTRLDGSSRIDDYDSDAYIYLEVNKLGHVVISGQLGGSHQEHSMKFKFSTDQTVLEELRQYLDSLVF